MFGLFEISQDGFAAIYLVATVFFILGLKGLSSPRTALKGNRNAIFSADGKAKKTPVYDGSKLGAGATIMGPAIIEEVTTTIVIEPGWTAKLDPSGSYVITNKSL